MSGEARDELLQRALTGDLSAPERAAVGDDQELAELEELARELDGAGARERERRVAEARALGAAPGEARTARVIERIARPRSRRVVLAAAAAVLSSVGLWWASRGSDAVGDATRIDGGVLLSGGAFERLALEASPRGGVVATWRARNPPDPARYDVVFRDPAGGGILLEVRDLEGTTWTLPRPAVASWPEEIRWEVRVYDRTGNEHGFGAAEARLPR